MKQIVFIGLDHMSASMATNLLKAGYLSSVFGLMQSAVDGLVAAGANVARSTRDAVQGADVVISMLPASRYVEGLYLDDDDLLAHITPGTLVLECSTTAPTSARKVRATTRERGLATLDASTSGDAANTTAGALTFVIDGDVKVLEKARPLLKAIDRDIFHIDPDGAGQVTRMCNNQLLAVLMIGTVETMALGAANGLEAKVLAEIVHRSSDGNWTLEVYSPRPGMMENAPASRDYGGDFMTQLIARDLGLAQEAAQTSTSSTPMDSLTLSLYRLLLKQGYAERNFSVVQKLFGPTQGQQTDRRVHAQAGRFDDTRSPP